MEETESQQPSLEVSVLIVSYNRAAALRRCLAALEQSTDRAKFEIVVVDNGSLDDTPSVQGEFPSVTWLRLPRNFGLTKALNIAMRTGKAELFLVLNPRAEVRPDTVSALSAALTTRADAVAACAAFTDPEGRPAPNLYRLPSAETIAAVARAGEFEPAQAPQTGEPAPVEFAGLAALMVRAYFLKGLRYIDEHYAQTWADAEVAAQMRHAGRSTLFVPAAHAIWHAEDDLRSSMPSGALALLAADWASGAATFASKHFGFAAALKVRLATGLGALAGFRIPLLVKLLGGQRVDGTQTIM